jgi:hypothetical protein
MIRTFQMRTSQVLAFLLCGLAAASTLGQRPVRGARLSFLQGSVSFDQADNMASQVAQPNLPLFAGTRLSTGEDGQAEIEFEDGSLIRLTPNTAVVLDALTADDAGNAITAVTLLRGLAYAELRATPRYGYVIAAGGDRLTPVENTTVRIDLDEPPAVFAVLDGRAHIDGPASSIDTLGNPGAPTFQADVRAGESLRPDLADAARYFLTSDIAEDSWDRWNLDLDQAATDEAGARTAARDAFAGAQGYGWSDLDANGSWYDVPGEGRVWQPQMAADDSGFDPYGEGAWTWAPGGGYLWASAYPWGWTPYRCGNWSYFSTFGWGWQPNAICGTYGFGVVGGGMVNIRRFPQNYRVPHSPLPSTGHSPAHPIVVVAGPRGPHVFRPGPTVEYVPLPRLGGPAMRPGTSALARDFPIDGATHLPVDGRPATVYPSAGRSIAARPGAVRAPTPAYSRQPDSGGRTNPSGGYTQPASRPAPGGAPTRVQQPATRPAPPVSHPAPPPPVAHPATSRN